VQHGLAVEADDRHVGGFYSIAGKECFDRFGMRGVHHRLGRRERGRPRGAVGHVRRRGGRAAQQRALLFRVGPVCRRPETGNNLTVGFDQRNIDAVL
jgi:hypothetical protein